MNIGELTMKRKYIMNNVDNLNDKQITELIEIIYKYDINYMKNNNGIFIFLKDIDETILNFIYEHVDYCLNQNVNNETPKEYKYNFLDEFIDEKIEKNIEKIPVSTKKTPIKKINFKNFEVEIMNFSKDI